MISRLICVAAAIAGASSLAACGEGPGTPSGRPEAMLRGVDRECFRARFVSDAINGGWSLKQESASLIMMQRPAPFSPGSFLATTGYGTPDQRMILTMIPNGRDLRVVMDGAIVSNSGTGQERSTSIRATAQDQAAFEAMARRAETACPAKS